MRDILKLAAHREEVIHLGADMDPVMMVIDVAPLTSERMRRVGSEPRGSVVLPRTAIRLKGRRAAGRLKHHARWIW